MKEWEIWAEGYRATGEHSKAVFIGIAWADTFDEACENFTEPADQKDRDGKVYIHKGDKLNLDKNPDGTYRRSSVRKPLEPGVERTKAIMQGGNYCIWGCQLFPTEAEARSSFG